MKSSASKVRSPSPKSRTRQQSTSKNDEPGLEVKSNAGDETERVNGEQATVEPEKAPVEDIVEEEPVEQGNPLVKSK